MEKKYREILGENLLQSAWELQLVRKHIFEQNNDPQEEGDKLSWCPRQGFQSAPLIEDLWIQKLFPPPIMVHQVAAKSAYQLDSKQAAEEICKSTILMS